MGSATSEGRKMDQQFVEREKELFKLNAKLNAKTKKIQAIAATKALAKPVHIHTANNYFNYYDEPACPSQKESQDEGLELMCKKINISNQPARKPQEIVYPFFNRQTARTNRGGTSMDIIHIHMPTGSFTSDGQADQTDNDFKSIDFKSEPVESLSFKNESLVTRFSSDSSAIPPAVKIPNLPMPNVTDVIPKSMEKKNISNDGLLKFLKSKVALLQTELEAGKNLNDTLEKENSKHQKKVKKLTTQVDKSTCKIDSLETSLKALQEKHTIDEQSLKDKDASIGELNAQFVALREELKETNHGSQVMEKRVLKTQEDYDMIKSKFEAFKDIEIIMRESAKDERIAYEEKIRKLRKGRMELLKAYKQQIILIDNLRKQNVCLEKAKALEIAEKEFLKVLDWNFADK